MDDITRVDHEAPVELDPAESLATVITEAKAIAPVPAATLPSSEVVIEQMTQTLTTTKEFVFRRIDSAIARLKALRERLDEEYRANQDGLIGFVRLVEDGLRDVNRLEKAADEIRDATTVT